MLVDPPVGGTEVPAPLLWVDHAIRHLGPGGRAVIALPAHAIADVPSARRSTDPHLVARLDGLLHDGHVEGVVVTPRRIRSDVVGPMTLWVVRRDPSPGREVIVVAPLEKRTRVRDVARGRPAGNRRHRRGVRRLADSVANRRRRRSDLRCSFVRCPPVV